MKVITLILSLAICYLTCFSQEKGTFKDTRDGKVYKTVKIGTQTWFAENLAYKSSNGCWTYKNNESNVSKYGYLYDWETSKAVCPADWHLPSDSEWIQLRDYLGGENIADGENVAGGKLKAKTDWRFDANGNSTNESGFNALPAGYRDGYRNNSCFGLGKSAYFWSSSPAGTEYAWHIYLLYDNGEVRRSDDSPSYGYSVRCLKD
jgi:uncharacterized protein (TIGR02145 family)